MKKLLQILTRGIVIGGAFGAKIGVFVGYFAQDTFIWISYLLFAGMILGLISSLAILSSQYLSNHSLEQTKSGEVRIQDTILVNK